MNFLKKTFFLTGPELNKKVFLLFIVIALTTIIELLSLGSIIPLIKGLVENNQKNFIYDILFNFDFVNEDNILNYLFLLILILFTFKYITNLYFIYLKAKINILIREVLSLKFFKTYLSKDLSFFGEKNTSELLRNCDQEIVVFTRCWNAIISLTLEIIIIILILILIIFVQPLITLVPFILLFLFSLIFVKLSKNFLTKIGEKRFDLQALKIKYLVEGFGSVREIKVNQNISYFIKSFKITLSKLLKITKIKMILNEVIRPTFEFLVVAAIISNAFILNYLEYSWEQTLTIIIIYGLASVRILPAFNKIVQSISNLIFNAPAVHKLYKELKDNDHQSNVDKVFSEKINFNKKLKFSKLSFGYNNHDQILNNLDINFNKGDIVGITGKSGTGKSSLLDIISGLIVPNSGQILVDDHIVNLNNIEWYNKISYASDKNYFIDDTVKQNITLNRKDENIDIHKLENVLRITNLLYGDNEFEIDLNKKMGEIGKNLSSGQKQRISLSRSLYKQCEILIMDESTNAIDEKSQDKIMDKIINFAKENRITLIIVSHDKKVLAKCQVTYLLENKNLRILNV